MADYILSCCSTADLTKAEFEKRDIHYVCFHYYLDDVERPWTPTRSTRRWQTAP